MIVALAAEGFPRRRVLVVGGLLFSGDNESFETCKVWSLSAFWQACKCVTEESNSPCVFQLLC